MKNFIEYISELTEDEWRDIYKKTLAFDFDGVIHNYNGWNNGEIYGDVIDGVKELFDLYHNKGYKIIITTSRIVNIKTYEIDYTMKKRVEEWMRKNNIYFDLVYPKFPAIAYIDDHAIEFDKNSKSKIEHVKFMIEYFKNNLNY